MSNSESQHPSRKNRRVLIIGSDGMRPDTVDPKLMPTYARLIKEGTLFTRFHAAYPSETRVSMSTLTTGVYPGKHGVVANSAWIHGFKDNWLQTGNHNHLKEYEQWAGSPLLLRPTLGDRLHAAGIHLAISGTSSSGAGLLWNIRHPEKVINKGTDYGVPQMVEAHRKLGPVPPIGLEQHLWAVKGMLDVHFNDPDNRAFVLWLHQPDKACHDYGLGSPEHLESLRWVDHCVAQILEGLQRRGEEMDLLLISDHGHSTLNAQGSLKEFIDQACQELGIKEEFLVSGRHIYSPTPVSEDVLQKLVNWLKDKPWCGSVYVRHNDGEKWGALPMEVLYGPIHHERAPLLAVNPTWSMDRNEHGVPGIVQSLSVPNPEKFASHGCAIPTDLHAFCCGYGPSFKKQSVSDIPCGLVDIAPTVCHLVGLQGEPGFDGRVLYEGLVDAPADKVTPQVSYQTHGQGTQRQPVRTAEVNGTRYILGSDA